MGLKNKSFIGTGWHFPPRFTKETRTVEMVKDEEDIKESITIFIGTRLGERIMRSNYGSIIHSYTYESIDGNSIKNLSMEIKINLQKFEPRINVIDVDATRSDSNQGLINFNIQYEIIGANVRDNIVYPFYINEGTDIK